MSFALASNEPLFALEVVQTHLTQDQNKFNHIIGIAQNNMNMTLDNIFVHALILDANNTILGNYSNQVAVHPLGPSEETPFDVLIYDKNYNSLIRNYTVSFTYEGTKTTEKDLKIHSTSSKLDATGFYYISGRITNNMNNISTSTTVIASLYDKNDDLISVWKAQSEPYDIPPLSTASFTIPVTDRAQGSNIHNYTLYSNSS
ncbi:MAG: FxLYD domain-containing protein [Candidatus Nitrosocosmicus sp.]|nr:FxLYD domain-containing protein [Candidatus Nitrosocosmicus sp.]